MDTFGDAAEDRIQQDGAQKAAQGRTPPAATVYCPEKAAFGPDFEVNDLFLSGKIAKPVQTRRLGDDPGCS
jgi:hypothetical protein